MIPLEDNIYRLVIAGRNTDNGDYWEQVLHYLVSDTTPGAHDAFEVAQELIEQWLSIRMPGFLPMLPTNVTVDTLSAKRADATGGPAATLIVNEPGEAPSACETVGNGAQLCWFGGVDPILMGRSYFPGIPNDSFDAGAWDAGYRAAAGTWIAAILDSLDLFAATGGAEFYITSRQIGVASQKAMHGLLRDVPGTQRRRLRR